MSFYLKLGKICLSFHFTNKWKDNNNLSSIEVISIELNKYFISFTILNFEIEIDFDKFK